MQVSISIEVEEENESICGRLCPFKCEDGCALFNMELEKVSLKQGWEYQEGSKIPVYRCWQCRGIQ